MGRGGKRDGAGRKAGAVTRKVREAANRIAEAGVTPLDYLLGVLNGTETFDQEKFEAAKVAAPYVHPRLAAVEHSGSIAMRPAREMSDDELAAIAAGGSAGASDEAPSSRLTH